MHVELKIEDLRLEIEGSRQTGLTFQFKIFNRQFSMIVML